MKRTIIVEVAVEIETTLTDENEIAAECQKAADEAGMDGFYHLKYSDDFDLLFQSCPCPFAKRNWRFSTTERGQATPAP